MKPDISIFFPAYNEEENIIPLIKKATKVLQTHANQYEIIVIVYEGSTDNTIPIVNELAKSNSHIRLVIQPKDKKGVGHAILMGFQEAKYQNIFYTDSDNQFDLNEIENFLPCISEYDIIAGYRKKRKDPLPRLFTSKVYNLLVKILFRVKEKDVDCAFRYVNKKIFEKVKLICKLGLGTTEILVKARKYGYKIKQIPVTHYPRLAGKSVFEAKGLSLPKPRVVLDLLKEMKVLKEDLKK